MIGNCLLCYNNQVKNVEERFIYCLVIPQTLCSRMPSYINLLNSGYLFQEFSQVPSSCVTRQNKQFSYEALACPIKHQYLPVERHH